MSITETGRSINEVLKIYQKMLRDMSEDEFVQTPAKGGWSRSEVYCHVLQVNISSLLAIEKCLHGKQLVRKYSLPFFTRIVLFLGKFPVVKYKTPEKVAAMVRKISREEARNQLIKFNSRLNELLPKIAKSTTDCRIKNPKLGMLNCSQWLRFMEIHTHHHLKQLSRIKKSIEKEHVVNS